MALHVRRRDHQPSQDHQDPRRCFGRPSFSRVELPKVPIELGVPFAGPTAKYVDRNVGWPRAFDNAPTVHVLDIDFRPAGESVVQHFQQMIDDGLVKA